MGFRNPFRITVDPNTGQVLMGDYGPDASATNPNRGPQGSVEYNIVTPGNYGWPYCIRDNVPYNDYNFATGASGPKFDCAAPVNNSPNNTGLTNLPPAKPATMWMGYTETDPRNPGPRQRRRPDGRPALQVRPEPRLRHEVPRLLRRAVVHRRVEQRLDQDRDAQRRLDGGHQRRRDASTTTFPAPHEMEFGPDGSLYVIDWGSGFNGNNADSGIYRIDYVKGASRPIAHAAATRTRPGAADRAVLERRLGRPRGHVAHLRVGLRRQRHDGLDRGQPDAHLHDRGQLQRRA